MTRRRAICSLLGAGAAAVSYPCYFEPRWFETVRRWVRLKRANLAKPVRIVQLSDFHASRFVPMSMIERAITLAVAEKPDLVCLTGDFITGKSGFSAEEYVRALKRLSTAARAFAVLGNHDGGSWAADHRGWSDRRLVERILEESGVELLHNRSERLQTGDSRLSLVGVGDLWSDEIDVAHAFAGVDSREPVVLLAHNPDSKDILWKCRWDLMLSGHTHGGQVIMPFAQSSYAPVVDQRYVAGLKPWGTRWIHVTRGVGNLGGVRFRCRPEISVLTVV